MYTMIFTRSIIRIFSKKKCIRMHAIIFVEKYNYNTRTCIGGRCKTFQLISIKLMHGKTSIKTIVQSYIKYYTNYAHTRMTLRKIDVRWDKTNNYDFTMYVVLFVYRFLAFETLKIDFVAH